MTVKELTAQLNQFPPDTEVIAVWDCVVDWEVKAVIPFRGKVVLDVDQGAGSYKVEDLESFCFPEKPKKGL